MTAGRPAVFLDRDGVLNDVVLIDGRPHPPASAGDVTLLPGVADACQQLRDAGFALVVVTNQPEIARGTTSFSAVDAVNAALLELLPLDEVVVCPHDDGDKCLCRKPKPGMVLDAAERLGLDLGTSVVVGDRWRDIEAGRRAGIATVFVDRGYHEQRPSAPDVVVGELIEAVPFIVERIDHEEARA